MESDLKPRRRALQMVYQRYLQADAEWMEACETLNAWFPEHRAAKTVAIGNPGSRIRHIHDKRDRAVLQLNIALSKLNIAKRRLARRRKLKTGRVLLLPAP